MKHTGNLTITTAEDAKKYAGLTKVTGNLYIYSSAKLDALTSVGGNLYIYSSAKLDALTSVGGNLYIYSSAKLDALTSVGGNLYIYSSAKLDALTSVGGNLYIDSSAKLDALTSVGGYLYIYSSAKLDALTSVGGDLYIYSSAKLDALTSVGGNLYIHPNGILTANRLYTGGYDKFTVIDGIGCVVLSTKNQNGVTVRLCRHSKIKKQKLVGDRFFVASRGGHNAHGKTIAEATRELAFKTGKRDIEQYRGMSAATRKTPAEWAFVYRMITGACQYGTNDFMERKGKLKKSYTLAEILAETNGAYGHKAFRNIVAARAA